MAIKPEILKKNIAFKKQISIPEITQKRIKSQSPTVGRLKLSRKSFACTSFEPHEKKEKIKQLIAKTKLIKPVILDENKIGIQEVKSKIEENFQKQSQWTIIRDLEGLCMKKFLSFNTTVIDMDEFTAYNTEELKSKIQDAMGSGKWLTLSFKETLCSISTLLRLNVISEGIMDPTIIKEVAHPGFRLIFASQKLEYPKSMIDSCILVSIDDEKCRIEKELNRFKRIKGIYKKDPKKIQREINFIEACFEGEDDRVKSYLEIPTLNANTKDLNDNTALMQASLKGHLKICRMLLDHACGGTDLLDTKGKETVHSPFTRSLKRCDINAVNKDGKTALHKAAYNGNSSIIKLLLRNGADPRIMDNSGNIPIDYIDNEEARLIMSKWNLDWTNGFSKENTDKIFENVDSLKTEDLGSKMKNKIREYLVAKAKLGDFGRIHKVVSRGIASIDSKNNDSQTLLSLAVVNGHFDCVSKMLQEYSPNVNTKDNKGWTPLMNAAFNGYFRIAKLLLANEADLNMKNNLGMKAVDLAKGNELKEYLQQETRNANLFNFEQILELSMTDPASLKDGSILNSFTASESEEEGNRAMFEKMGRKRRLTRQKKSRQKNLTSDGSNLKRNVPFRKSRFRSSVSQLKISKMVQKQRSAFSRPRQKRVSKAKPRRSRYLSPEPDMSKAHFLLFD